MSIISFCNDCNRLMAAMICCLLSLSVSCAFAQTEVTKDAADYGFLPGNTAEANHDALQAALAGGGRIVVSRPGVYDLTNTVVIDSDTHLQFLDGVVINKCLNSHGTAPAYVLINRGAFTRTYDHDITVEGLNLKMNRIDQGYDTTRILGLQGSLSFFYVRNLRVSDFTTLDIGSATFALQVCTFENIVLENIHIEGDKDGIHLGRGRGFVLRNCRMRTFDDPIALNAHDYIISNPELGWLEDGIVEDCTDMSASSTTGFFCRLLAGGWREWHEGMQLQNSDAVISNGRIYRVNGQADGVKYISQYRPVHAEGIMDYGDGINWAMTQEHDVVDNCGVRNVTFNGITLSKERNTAFCIMFDNNEWSRGYYPNSPVPSQGKFVFNGIVQDAKIANLISCGTPVDTIIISNSTLCGARIIFRQQNIEGIATPPIYVEFRNVHFRGDGSGDSYRLFDNPSNLDVSVRMTACRSDVPLDLSGANIIEAGILSQQARNAIRAHAVDGRIRFTIETMTDVVVSDASGRIIFRHRFAAGEHETPQFDPGVYLLNGLKVLVD